MNVLKTLGLFLVSPKLETGLLFLYSEMTAHQDVSSFVRILSYIYVNVWIPIRLNYLRLKIALRPAFRVGLEVLSLMNMVWSLAPISMLMIIGEIISELSKEWLRLVCLGYEKAIGVTPGSIYEKSMTISAIVDVDLDSATGEEQTIVVTESVNQPSESDQTEQSVDLPNEPSVEPSEGSDLPSQIGESTNVTIEVGREAEPERERKNIAISEDSHNNNSDVSVDGVHIE